jgi:alpha-1,6-mannosyltransferase
MSALTVVGLVGTTLITAAGVADGAHGPTGSALERDVVALVPHGTANTVFSALTLAGGLVLVFGAWLVLGLLLKRGATTRPLLKLAGVWSIPLFIGPPLFSRDVYSYAALGRMVNLHLNPYHVGPAWLGSSNFALPLSSAWLDTHSPYGPLFIGMSSAVVRIGGSSVVNAVFMLRAIEVAGIVMIAWALPKLAVRAGKDPARALWLGVCNPLVLVHFIGGAHNDALMLGLMLVGVVVAAEGRPGIGIALCVLAAAIKAPALLGAVFIAVEAIRALPPQRRAAAAGRFFGITAATFAVVTWMTRLGWGWVGALGVPGSNHLLLTPTTAVSRLISDVTGHDDAVLTLVRGLGYLITAVAVVYLIWRAPKIGTTRALGLSLAVVVALGPIVLPWYALWGVVVLAAAGRRIERGFAIFSCVLLSFVAHPSGAAMPDPLLMTVVFVLGGAAIAIAWRPVRSWIRGDLAVAIDDYRRGGQTARVVDIARRALPFSRYAKRTMQNAPAARQ